FLLTGDANQIVHPNFFAWSRIKSLLWKDPDVAGRERLHILHGNFRNSTEATAVANRLLRVKQRRFGSVDRESNFLVRAASEHHGTVELVRETADAMRALDERSRQSTKVAVLVLRDEDKARAREHFRTPLVFSVREAKGLEYESVILYRVVAAAREDYAQVASGVRPADLAVEEGCGELDYRRARDKSDKTLDRYKFFVNALYVALTRAVSNVVWIEPDVDHPLLRLLDLDTRSASPALKTQPSTREEWQMEARRLELQGRLEQAEAIRDGILHESGVPWPVWDEARVRQTLSRVFRERVPGDKPRQQLLEIAACHRDAGLAKWLAYGIGFGPARNAHVAFPSLARKYLSPYAAVNVKEILRLVDRHGTEYRTPMNQTPLMAAAAAGNVALVDALLERGAHVDAVDHTGRSALHWALATAFEDAAFAARSLAAIYDRVAPPCVDLAVDERLIRLDRHHSEYFLWHTLVTMLKTSFGDAKWRNPGGFDTATVLKAWRDVPADVLRAGRNTRQHLSHVLSRNEIRREYAYNRKLFVRLRTGFYQFNPGLAVRESGSDGERWVPIYEALNLAFVRETALPRYWRRIDTLLAQSGIAVGPPIAATLYESLRGKERPSSWDNPVDPMWEWTTEQDLGSAKSAS
ncbi:MAG: ankyrin repeat domain-containing protein, partial [Casimicrobiaceae bacterium]